MKALKMAELSFRKASNQDIPSIVALVNSAFRGESSKQGWTTEADLLDGVRTTEQDIRQLIRSEDSFLMLCHLGAQLVGSVHVNKEGARAHIGMFVISPGLPGRGIGKQLLEEAEKSARRDWAVRGYVMVVITFRNELTAFYERRGYRRTGVMQEFPVNPALWTPKVAGLQLEVLEKQV
jgi:ribosomal protein S18 acetylase RimI-like enzyme